MKRKVIAPPSFHVVKQEDRLEELIENLIRCVASAQVRTMTNEAALSQAGKKLNHLATLCEDLEKRQQEILKSIAHQEQRVERCGE